MSNETESILDLQIEVIQASIYCDIIKRLLLQHRSVSIVKVIVFSFIIKKQQYLQKNIYTGRNRDDLVLKFLSQASGLFDELCEQMPYIFQSIDLLVKDAIYEDISKEQLQIILFDDKEPSELGITPDRTTSLLLDGKSGFNPFYSPVIASQEDSPDEE